MSNNFVQSNFNFNIKSLFINDKENTCIKGYATVFNIVDNHNDIILKGAFHSNELANIKLLWQHNISQPIGVIKHITEDEYGLKIEAEINNNIKLGSEISELIKQGAIEGLSIGFFIKQSFLNESGKRVIKKANLAEISIVTFPANNKATIKEVKNDEAYQNIVFDLVKLDQLIQKLSKIRNEKR